MPHRFDLRRPIGAKRMAAPELFGGIYFKRGVPDGFSKRAAQPRRDELPAAGDAPTIGRLLPVRRFARIGGGLEQDAARLRKKIDMGRTEHAFMAGRNIDHVDATAGELAHSLGRGGCQ
jgi:hypothetical protein